MFFKWMNPVPSLSMKEAADELVKDKEIYLIDVRTKEEYAAGHIPGSINVPLGEIRQVERLVEDKEGRIFTYCHSGGRSSQAAMQMKKMGYNNVTNIGGIVQWRGKLERRISG